MPSAMRARLVEVRGKPLFVAPTRGHERLDLEQVDELSRVAGGARKRLGFGDQRFELADHRLRAIEQGPPRE